MTAIDAVRTLFESRGQSRYGQEAVTQLEHALQAARYAELARSTPELITAALLHDVGHLLHEMPDDVPDHGHDDLHERVGARWAESWFGPSVVRPLELHVAAKRYLCATDSRYAARLSEPSVRSLALQGGPMSPDEALSFEADPHFADAIRLRHWDEAAKVPGSETPSLEHYLTHVARAAELNHGA